jgi:hypothetical protein
MTALLWIVGIAMACVVVLVVLCLTHVETKDVPYADDVDPELGVVDPFGVVRCERHRWQAVPQPLRGERLPYRWRCQECGRISTRGPAEENV